MEQLISLFGLLAMTTVAYTLSTNRKAVKWWPVISGVLLQLSLGLFIMRTPWGLQIAGGARIFSKPFLITLMRDPNFYLVHSLIGVLPKVIFSQLWSYLL